MNRAVLAAGGVKHHSLVVPANAGTHTPCPIDGALG